MQELQSQRDALAKALRQSRAEADAAAQEAQEARARAQAVEDALAGASEQVSQYESGRQAVALQQQALQQQMQDLNRRERVADETCKSFAAARPESQAAVAALKLELSASVAQLQRAQGQLQIMWGSQGVLQRLEEVHGRLKRRGEAIMQALRVSAQCRRLQLLAVSCVVSAPHACTRASASHSHILLQVSRACACMSSCFSAWSKRLAQRRFHSLSYGCSCRRAAAHAVS